MTVRTNSIQTCDRCMKPFNERHLRAGESVPVFKQRGLSVTESVGSSDGGEGSSKLLFSFEDLCPDCSRAVDNLLVRLRLDARTPSPGEGDSTPAKRTRRRRVVAVEEYGEDKQPEPPEQQSDDPGEVPDPAPTPEPDQPVAASEESSEEVGSGGTDGLIVDPVTGDKYDPVTGEVMVRSSNGTDSNLHPF